MQEQSNWEKGYGLCLLPSQMDPWVSVAALVI